MIDYLFGVRRLRPYLTIPRALPIVAVFLAVFGSKLWIMQSYGNDVPYWDQWSGEGAALYKPLLEQGWRAVDWLSAHNEHRIVLARLSAVLLLYANAQWDPLVQMCWEAVCAASIAVLVTTIVLESFPWDRSANLLLSLVVVGFSLPYGWENTLGGFQTPFYYLLFISFLLFRLCAVTHRVSNRRAAGIATLAALSLVTLASGALTCAAAACALIVRLIVTRGIGFRRSASIVLLLIACALVGFGSTPTMAHHEALKAHGIREFLTTFNSVLGWPGSLGLLTWLPLAVWSFKVIGSRRIDEAGMFLIALATFVLLNTAAIAYARSAEVHGLEIGSRYTDVVWLSWLANLWATVLLAKEFRWGNRRISRALAIGAVFVYAAYVLVAAGLLALERAAERGRTSAIESANTHDYVRTGDYAALASRPYLAIPHPDAEILRLFLDDPTLRKILPPGVRPRVIEKSGIGLHRLLEDGLIPDGVPPSTPAVPPPHLGDIYGTFSNDEGDEHVARFVSPPIRAEGAYVRTLVSGYLGQPGLTLSLEDTASGRRVDLIPNVVAGARWIIVKARIPGPEYRVIAEDAASGTNGWFAFTDPVELGRLRGVTEYLMRHGKTLAVIGFIVFIASLMALSPGALQATSRRRHVIAPRQELSTSSPDVGRSIT